MSTTYIAPSSVHGEVNDVELHRFLQSLVAGVTGIKPSLVRPRWQSEPPNEPDFHVSWAAVGELRRTRDAFTTVLHVTDPGNFDKSIDTVYRNEILEVLASFYGPEAEANAELFAMGLGLAQNRIAMQQAGFGLVEVGDALMVPALIKERWLRGMDVSFSLRRQQAYTYPSPNVIAAKISIAAIEEAGAPYGQAPYGQAPFGGFPGFVLMEFPVFAGYGDGGYGDGGAAGYPQNANDQDFDADDND